MVDGGTGVLMSRKAVPPALRAKRIDPDDPPERQRLSAVIEALPAAGAGDRIGVDDIIEALGDRAFGMVLLVFAAPNVLPIVIPGTSSVTAVPIILAGLQMLLGRGRLWLPRFLLARSFPRADFAGITTRLASWVRRVEGRLRPTLPALTGGPGQRLVGAMSLLLGGILFLPIPLGNIVPGLAVGVMALGLLERDGRAVALGLAIAIFSIAVVVAVVFGLLEVFLYFLRYFTA